MLIDARKAEHEGNDEKAKELYTAIINSFPDNNITKEAKLELNELLKTMRKKANKLLVLQLVGVVLFFIWCRASIYIPIDTVNSAALMIDCLRQGYPRKKCDSSRIVAAY
jgi:hypothetical protein